jgi:hypothetical protein
MKLTQKMKRIFTEFGYNEEDFAQLQSATQSKNTICIYCGEKITHQQAIDILGLREYLSGISRSAYHGSAYRENAHGNAVFFDSWRMFR